MDASFQYRVIEPKKMDESQRLSLAWKVYHDAQQVVFNGVTFEEFYHSVFSPDTVQTKIMIYTHNDEIIGYCTFQLYKIHKSKLDFDVIMTEMCLKEPAYEKHIHPINFFVKESANYIFHHPFTKVCMIDTLVSPVIYKKACKTAFRIYPTYDKEVPHDLEKLSHIAARKFHWKFKSIGKFMVRKLNWKVKNKYVARDVSVDPNKDYYSKILPDYNHGKGLVVVVPLNVLTIIGSIFKVLFHHGQHVFKELAHFGHHAH